MRFDSWITSSLVRHFPSTEAQASSRLVLQGARNERYSFQVAVRVDDCEPQTASVSVRGPDGWSIRVRRIGYVPVRHYNQPLDSASLAIDGVGHIPGYVPDPLYDESDAYVPPGETHAFWVNLTPGKQSGPGSYDVEVEIKSVAGVCQRHTVQVVLHDLVLAPRHDFHVTNWFYNDALIDWYKTDQFDERYWEIVERYMRDVAEHGQDTLYVPVFTPPLDGVKTPSQLLRVYKAGPDKYSFDWTDVKRYITLAQAAGVTYFEWCHLFTQWGAKYALHVYQGQGKDEQMLWPADTSATSQTYRAFLSQYLPQLRTFLLEQDILDVSFFHVSDEPHGEEDLAQYRTDRALLRELAPWMSVMDALSEIEFGRQHLTDAPSPSIRTALDFVAEGIPCWCYYCCGPRGSYLQRLLDTALPKIAMHGMLFYRWPLGGFLHWGYNYWYASQTRELIDPFTTQDGRKWERGWAYGDPFMVYPGPDGPIDSMRWEVFAESLQDYALLQTLGVDRNDPLLEPLNSFDDFPVDEDWRQSVRQALLQRI